jgi:hypothetical protein
MVVSCVWPVAALPGRAGLVPALEDGRRMRRNFANPAGRALERDSFFLNLEGILKEARV